MSFTSPLQDITVSKGQDVTLTCETSSRDQQVTWSKNGTEIEHAGSQKYAIESVGEKHELIIKNADEQDTGKYTAAVGEEETTAMLCVEGRYL